MRDPPKCERCGGYGTVPKYSHGPAWAMKHYLRRFRHVLLLGDETCPKCKGSGTILTRGEEE